MFAYVALAAMIADPAEKRRLLEQAFAIDVSTLTSRRLTNAYRPAIREGIAERCSLSATGWPLTLW